MRLLLLLLVMLWPTLAQATIYYAEDWETFPTGQVLTTPVYNQLLARGWENGGVVCQEGTTIGSPCSMQITSTRAHGGTKALMLTYNPGEDATRSDGGQPWDSKISRWLASPLSEIWVRYYAYYEKVNTSLPSGFISGVYGGSSKQHYFNPAGADSILAILAYLFTNAFSTPGYYISSSGGVQTIICPNGNVDISCNVDPNVAGYPATPYNSWVCFQYHIKLNTVNQRDGVLQTWMNGQSITNYTNVNWRNTGATATALLKYFQIYRQGAINQYRYEDDMTWASTQAETLCGAAPPPDTIPPTQVTGVTVTGTTNTTATITQAGATDNLNDLTAYRYELCAGASCSNFALWVTTGTVLTTTLTGLTANTTYNLRINAQDGSGNLGPYSTTVPFTTTNVADITRITSGTDDFNRANNADVGAAYDAGYTGHNALQIVSNAVEAAVAGFPEAQESRSDALANDQWIEATIGVFNDASFAQAGAFVRMPAPATNGGYVCVWVRNGGATTSVIYEVGLGTPLASSGTVTWLAGDRARCEAQGSTIRFYRNDALVLSATSSTYTSGRVGLTVTATTLVNNTIDAISWGVWGVVAAPVITNAVTDTTGSQLTYGTTTPTYIRVQTDTTNEVFSIGTLTAGRYNRAGGQWAYGLTFVCFFAQDATHTESGIETDHQCDSLVGLTAQPPVIDHGPATGVLRHLGTTPWLTNDSGNAVYLTGISGGYDAGGFGSGKVIPNPAANCLNNGNDHSAPFVNDYATAFANVISTGHNYTRCWITQVSHFGTAANFAGGTYNEYSQTDDIPWLRTSTRTDTSTGTSIVVGIYDLNTFNQNFFDRIRTRILSAVNQGVTPSIMFFTQAEELNAAFHIGFSHPMYATNNINGVSCDTGENGSAVNVHCEELMSLMTGANGAAILGYQDAYVRKLIDTLNDIDGIIWEVCNECGDGATYGSPDSTNFVNHIADTILTYEAANGRKVHPIMMTPYPDTDAQTLANVRTSIAVLAPEAGKDYQLNPPVNTGTHPQFYDSDHTGTGTGTEVSGWPWKSFTRGVMPVALDGREAGATRTLLKTQMGQTLTYANKMHLAGMLPVANTTIIATGYGLKEDCKEYLMFQPAAAGNAIDLTACGGGTSFTVEYLNPATGAVTTAANVLGGASRNFIAAEMRVVYLKLDPTADVTPPTVFGPLPSGVQPVGTTSVTLQVSTSEAATCRYGSTAGVAYASQPSTFTVTGGVTHTATLSGLTVGSYTRYVRCIDAALNATLSDTVVAWSIPAPTDTTPPVLSSPAPSGTLAQGTTSTVISMTSDELADLKYSTTDVAYASMTSTMTTVDGLHHSATVTGLTNGSAYTYYVRGQDRSVGLNVDVTSTIIAFQVAAPSDTTPPVLSGGSPTGTLAAGTTSVTMSVQTNENATCKYSTTAGVVYASMATTFGTTGTQAHSTTVAGLVNGTTYTRYVRCIDGAANADLTDYAITWTIASPPADVTPPVLSGGAPSGQLPAGTTSVLLQVNTNEAATCKYNTVAGRVWTHPSSVTFTTTGTTAHSTTITGLVNNTTYTRYIRCRDTTGNMNGSDYVVTWSIAAPVVTDTTPPVRSGGSPSGALPSGTTSVSMQVTTDETSTCKYGTVIATAYASIANTFSTTGGTAHSQTISGLSDGTTLTYYVRCSDALGNANTNDYTITWTITAAADVTPPIRSGGSPNGTAFPVNTTSVSMQLSTNETATCKYGTVIGTAYASIANTFTTTGTTAHSQTIATANGTTYTYYVRCLDVAANANTTDYTITWSVAAVVTPDTTPPVLTLGGPTGTLPTTTTSVTLTVTSSEVSTCKYGTIAATAYASIASTFTSTGGTTHTQTLAVAANTIYTYYIRCQDGAGNPNLSDYVITWSVAAAPDVTPATLTNGAPTGTLPGFTTTATLQVTTSEPATCKYGTIAATAYAGIANTFGTTGGTAHSQALAGLAAGTYTKYIRCSDASGNANLVDYVVTWVIDADPDITPPLRSVGSPSGVQAIGTTSVAMTLTTDEDATCKYGTTAGVAYASIANTFTTTGTTSHSQTITPLVNGGSYTYYVRCQDGTPNANTTDFIITWSVAADVTAPIRSAGLPSGSQVSGTIVVTMSLTTSEAATCRYSTSPGVAYASMTKTFTTTGGTAQSQLIAGLVDGQVSIYYIRCQDTAGNANTDDFIITWFVAITNDGTAPTAPTNLTCTTFSSSQAFCSFTAGTDAVGVTGNQATIGVDQSGTCTPSIIINSAWGTTSPQPLIGLSGGVTYCVTMQAFDAAGNLSTASNTSTFASTTVVDPIPPSNVIQFEPILGGTLYNTVGLTWQPGTDNVAVVRTDLYRCTGEGCTTFDVKFSTVQNSFMDTTVAPNTTYRYEAFHVDGAGNISVVPSTIIRIVTPLSTVGATQGICPCKPKH